MSPKELLYIEDILGHEKQIDATCTDTATKLTDNDLKSLVNEVGKKHKTEFNKFYGLL